MRILTWREDQDLVARFWSKVQKGDGCWEWTGSTRGGYGRFTFGVMAMGTHRFSWELTHGPIPDGKVV